jgi:hypothetical protein
MPLLETLTDASEEILLQDNVGRTFKITMCDEDGEDFPAEEESNGVIHERTVEEDIT